MDRLFVLFAVLFSLVILSSAVDEVNGVDDELLIRQVVPDGEDPLLHAERHFSTFKAKFGKSYGSQEEHDYRFGVFQANLRRAKVHQKLDPSAVHGVTKFSDLTPAEFRRQFLGLKNVRLPADAQKAPILPTNDLPTDFDWRDHGAVTGVKDQVPHTHTHTHMYVCMYRFEYLSFDRKWVFNITTWFLNFVGVGEIRVLVDRAGRLVQRGHWKERIIWRLGSS
jgi:hypothetical protein